MATNISETSINGITDLQMDCESEWRLFHEWLNRSEVSSNK